MSKFSHVWANRVCSAVLGLILMCAAGLCGAQSPVAPVAGTGTADDPYQFTEMGNLVWLKDQTSMSLTLGKHYKLMNDIDASDTKNWNDAETTTDVLEGFQPIGGDWMTSFTGTFDGNGKKITGLTINRPNNIYSIGLFGHVVNGEIRNLGMENTMLSMRNIGDLMRGVGALAGFTSGTIENCYSVNTETSLTSLNQYNHSSVGFGGLVGVNYYGKVSNCYSSGTVTNRGDVGVVAGLVGKNYGTMEKCRFTGLIVNLIAVNGNGVGGLVGGNSGTMTDCSAVGSVTGERIGAFGGLVDGNAGTIKNSFAAVDLKTDYWGTFMESGYFGGLTCGNWGGTIENCYATGDITVTASLSEFYIAGLAGSNSGIITNCHASGNVIGNLTGSSSGQLFTGGLVGECTSAGSILNCRATGNVTGNVSSTYGTTGYYVGGLVGNHSGTIAGCFASGNVTGNVVKAAGSGVYNSIGGLVGRNSATVTNSYATNSVVCSVPLEGFYYGCLAGSNAGTITNCFVTGSTVNTNSQYRYTSSGLVGINNQSATQTSCYLDYQSSGKAFYENGVDKTTAEMKRQATFAGWDFSGTWAIQEGVTYPYLRAFPAEFSLNVNVENPGGGTVSVSPQAATYAAGTVATISVNPNPGYAAVDWNGDSYLSYTNFPIPMAGNKTVKVQFVPYTPVRTLSELQAVKSNMSSYYVLMNNIDASDTKTWNDAGTTTDVLEGFEPIGTDANPFTGVFDGHGKTVTGLTINRVTKTETNMSAYLNVGLFGKVSKGKIGNLRLENVTVTGTTDGGDYVRVGALAGSSEEGLIRNCTSSGSVAGNSLNSYKACSAGGLVGSNLGAIKKCSSSCDITGNTNESGFFGGLVAANGSVIENCYATGRVSGIARKTDTAYLYVGGLVGYIYSPVRLVTLVNSYAVGFTTGTATFRCGGLVGWKYNNTPLIKDCYWDVQTTGRDTSACSEVGKTTAEMKQQATFAGWDFPKTWSMDGSVNSGYPYLNSDLAIPDAITVTIQPAEAVAAGAQWSVDNGATWRNSGEPVSGLSPGNYVVTFKSVAGWNSPAAQTVVLEPGGSVIPSGIYVGKTGSLLVNISGTTLGQWRIADVVPWTSGGVQVNNLEAGNYTVEFSNVPGLVSPGGQSITVNADSVTVINGTYAPPAGVFWSDVLG